MKKLLTVVMAFAALSFAASAEARCGKKRCQPCVKPRVERSCPKVCAPKCDTQIQKTIHWKPCTKTVTIQGKCPYETCVKTTVCESTDTKCVGPCFGDCPEQVSGDCNTFSAAAQWQEERERKNAEETGSASRSSSSFVEEEIID